MQKSLLRRVSECYSCGSFSMLCLRGVWRVVSHSVLFLLTDKKVYLYQNIETTPLCDYKDTVTVSLYIEIHVQYMYFNNLLGCRP